MNKQQTITIGIIGALSIFGTSFYGGMKYGESKTPIRGQFGSGQFSGQNGTRMRGANGGGFTAGEILSKDATSVTIKMQDGSTKIVLVGPSTQVMKSASGTMNDLSVGTNVVVSGSSNSDGSVTATSVQIRPAGQTGSVPPQPTQ